MKRWKNRKKETEKTEEEYKVKETKEDAQEKNKNETKVGMEEKVGKKRVGNTE